MSSLLVFNRIYRQVGIFSSCELLPMYFPSDLPHPSPLPKVKVQYIQTVCRCGGGGVGVLSCVVDHILQDYTVSDQIQNLKLLHHPKQNHQ